MALQKKYNVCCVYWKEEWYQNEALSIFTGSPSIDNAVIDFRLHSCSRLCKKL